MARAVLTVLVIVLLNILVGCAASDTGRGQLIPAQTKTSLGTAPVLKVARASELDIVEQMAVNRQAYHQGLKFLADYYAKTGDNMKLQWAKKELAALDAMPQYKYIVEASLAGPNLKASTSIPEADELYKDTLELEKRARGIIIIKNENLLRLVLDKYNQLIRKHPTSDKIDDAAFKAGAIYEYFNDYTIALLYYQRVYQKAVETIKFEGEHTNWKEFAENRILELTKSDEGGNG